MEIYEKHPELFHYTDRSGVLGILRSQTLWATHYQFQNDPTETLIMIDELKRLIYSTVKNVILERYQKSSFKNKRQLQSSGGVIRTARKETELLVDMMYKLAFEGMPNERPFSEPYISSFCSHMTDDEYVRKNGLLSQWRGYAGSDGYAIVFNTRRLSRLYEKENKQHNYLYGHFSDVVYQGDEVAFKTEFNKEIEIIIDFLLKLSSGNDQVSLGLLESILSMFTRLKHRAFREEREVRGVLFPLSNKAFDEAFQGTPAKDRSKKRIKDICHLKNGKPYIVSFDFERSRKLPIKRIIVGPSRSQKEAYRKIKDLTQKYRITVQYSETPLSFDH